MNESTHSYEKESIYDWTHNVLCYYGANSADAAVVADSLIAADGDGIFSHGLLRLPLYISAMEQGGINLEAQPAIVHEKGGVTVVDGDGAFGQCVMNKCVEAARESSARNGIALVLAQRSGHYGAGRYWTDKLADEGIAAILTSTAGPVATPHGGSEPILGTNPLTLSMPLDQSSALVADMATTTGAYGKIVAANNEGASIPLGWGVDGQGNATNDPSTVLNGGALLPFGGHKGSGLSILVEALSASMAEGSYEFQTTDMWDDPSSRMNTGHMLIAIDYDALQLDPDTVAANVSELRERVRHSAAESTVLAPGDFEASKRQLSREQITLSASTANALSQIASLCKIALPSDAAR